MASETPTKSSRDVTPILSNSTGSAVVSRRTTISRTVSALKSSSAPGDRGIISSLVNYTLGDYLSLTAPVLTCPESPGASLTLDDFQVYLVSIKGHWEEYKLSSQAREAQTLPRVSVDLTDQVPPMFFADTYRVSGIRNYPPFGKSLRSLCASHSESVSELSSYVKRIDKVIMRNVPSYIGLIHSLSAMSSLEEAVVRSQTQVQKVRGQLSLANSHQVLRGLEYILKSRRKTRGEALLSVLGRLEMTIEAMRSIEALVGVGDYSSAEELIGSVRKTLDVDLAGMRQCEPIRQTLARFSLMVSKDVEKEFLVLVESSVLSTGTLVSGTKLKDLASVLLRKGALRECIETALVQRLVAGIGMEDFASETPNLLFVFKAAESRIESLAVVINALLSLDNSFLVHPLQQLFEIVCDHIVVGLSDVVPCDDNLESLRSFYMHSHQLSSHIEKCFREVFGHGHSLIAAPLVQSVLDKVQQVLHASLESGFPKSDETWNKTVSVSVDADLHALFGNAVLVDKRQVQIYNKTYLLVPSFEQVLSALCDLRFGLLHFPPLVGGALQNISHLVREWNSFVREQLLQGGLTSKTTKPVNATNLAMGCHSVSFLAVTISTIASSVCGRYGIHHPMVVDLSEHHPDEEMDGCSEVVSSAQVSLNLTELVHEVKIELNDTRLEILSKLAEILVDRFKAINTEWSFHGNTAAFESVVKDFGQMFAVLSKSLDNENIWRVFGRALADCTELIQQLLARENNNLPEAFRDQVRVDLLFLYQNLAAHTQLVGLLKNFLSSLVMDLDTQLPLFQETSLGALANEKLKQIVASDS